MTLKTAVVALLIVIALGCGCGSRANTSAPGSTGTTTPPSNVPNIAGNWSGGMNFSTVGGNLNFTISEDGSGNLTGTAVSAPPSCEFNLAVSGVIYQDGQFYLQTSDNGQTAAFSDHSRRTLLRATSI